jgi:hypothetical protein
VVVWRGARRRRCSAEKEEAGESLSSSKLEARLLPRPSADETALLQPLMWRPCFDPAAGARSF